MTRSSPISYVGSRLLLALIVAATLSCASIAGRDGQDAPDGRRADIIAVQVMGEVGAYIFSVTISSPDTGCERYTDWWEVLLPDGTLVYRRILEHSHANEQPFTRSGSPVAVGFDQEVIVRAHMNLGGYGGTAMRGSVDRGFTPDKSLSRDFAANVEREEPLPDGCAF